jgi:hypothetical protein
MSDATFWVHSEREDVDHNHEMNSQDRSSVQKFLVKRPPLESFQKARRPFNDLGRAGWSRDVLKLFNCAKIADPIDFVPQFVKPLTSPTGNLLYAIISPPVIFSKIACSVSPRTKGSPS